MQTVLDSDHPAVYDIATHAPGPAGRLPLSAERFAAASCGHIFSYIEWAGMGWPPAELDRKVFLLLSTKGGLRAPDGTPVALGFHTGHWELGLAMEAAARQITALGALPVAAYCTDPCDGCTQGTPGMMDSLAYRNDAATVFRRLIRSVPLRRGVLGLATCDKGLPAMMMALSAMRDLPCAIVPGGVTLPPTCGEDLGAIQSLSTRFVHGEVSLDYALETACRACASAGGGCHFLGTAATSQVVAEALGMALPHSALAPSGQAVWLDIAERSARALLAMETRGTAMKDIVTEAAVHNAMVVHAAFGGSTNLLLHLPAVAHAAGLPRPALGDWIRVNRQTPRLVDVLPNGPVGHPTVQVYLAGGVPEVMLHLRRLGLLELDELTVAGVSWNEALDWWEQSERRHRMRERLRSADGVDPDRVILSPERARECGLASTATFPRGNLAPEGSVIKSTAMDPSLTDASGVYRKVGPARVFLRERDAIRAIKDGAIHPGDVMVLICMGPMGSGMEEILQITAALKALPWGKHVAVVSDARFSGLSTGPCIGHVWPEALAGGPIGKVLEGDRIQIVIDRNRLEGSVDLVGEAGCPPEQQSVERGNRLLAARAPRPDLSPQPGMPDDTRLWAALQNVGGGTWGGCVYDVEAILRRLKDGSGP
ncbi:MAG: YjhG/YagF family D-xylonate dehydratase [Candidatus Sumerlaeia bacterium]|nr:YjhG/YagF family D-xylonate dehydratase [Candidatus Sumerlaeia bacterium]